ncbi:hypothetical protein IMCC3317_16920 [Kordia antarctica]|uniref:Outer membrane protein beta-barrel domain-containing protein n=1 Tax=Kordia antarctica TaxID=1218801 RepID=A0A7L4ZIH9_9FLAO|nr:DUF6588 family protein [Kordia antarctica]QHI36330.1 hypothetical protein IMCC3317_16920 [Kordia antarctica]
MKKLQLLFIAFLAISHVNAQENINELLAAGIDDAKRFTTDYIAPASEGLAYGINTGWFNSAKAPKRFGFEISIVGNISLIKDEKKEFQLNVADYENIRFPDNSPSKTVATALGHNEPDVTVIVTYDDPVFGSQEVEITLPTGIGSENVDIIPTAYVQASFSPFKGTQVKARFFPKVDSEDVDLSTYGFGIQQEFTSWLPAEKAIPVAISGLIAYTHLDANYDFTESSNVNGNNQQVATEVNTFLFQLIVGTKFKIINFYGGLGYLKGDSTTDLLGTYTVTDGVLFSETITNPFSIEQDISGVRGTIGANLKLGFFSINADYSLGEFDSASLGLNFSF